MRVLRKIIIAILLTGTLGAGVIFFIRGNIFRVKIIECWEEGNYCQRYTLERVRELFWGKNIFLLNSKKSEEKLAKNDHTIREIKIIKKIPNKLIFEIKKRQGAVGLGERIKLEKEKEATSSSELSGGLSELPKEFLIVDEEGVLLEKTTECSLPPLILEKLPPIQVGEKIEDETLIQGIKILNNLRLNLFQPKIGEIITPHSLKVLLENKIIVLFSLNKDIRWQLDSLQFILDRAKIEGRVIKKIDLRFDKPVGVYE